MWLNVAKSGQWRRGGHGAIKQAENQVVAGRQRTEMHEQARASPCCLYVPCYYVLTILPEK